MKYCFIMSSLIRSSNHGYLLWVNCSELVKATVEIDYGCIEYQPEIKTMLEVIRDVLSRLHKRI